MRLQLLLLHDLLLIGLDQGLLLVEVLGKEGVRVLQALLRAQLFIQRGQLGLQLRVLLLKLPLAELDGTKVDGGGLNGCQLLSEFIKERILDALFKFGFLLLFSSELLRELINLLRLLLNQGLALARVVIELFELFGQLVLRLQQLCLALLDLLVVLRHLVLHLRD